MNYEEAGQKYTQVRDEIDALERAHKATKAAMTEKLRALESWFTAKAQEDGLETIKTTAGTGYWSTHNSATVSSRADFFDFCVANGQLDMLESRASKVAVKSYIDANGAPPPGVDFKSVSVFNFRRSTAS
jgi:hypothetical protein